jgi:signal transduction histidine kinase
MSRETGTLLIVDDEELNRDGLARRLQRHGYSTCTAASGREGMALLAERRFDLVLLDIMMPGMNGLEVLKHLRRVDSLLDLPVIMVTARGDSQDVVEALELGANDYLTKPLDFPIVLARIRTQLTLKRAEEALRETDRHKDEFLAVLGHELRNPLAPLLNALRLLRLQRDRDHVETERLLGVMERQVNHLCRLVDDLLDVNRISRGKIELRKGPLNLASVLERCVERVRPQLEERQHTLGVSWSVEPLPLEGDPARLEQVFTNLLTNAGKYTPPGGHIEVCAVREAGEAVVRVKDNGIGIRAEMLGRVFDMFEQADRVSGQECEGLGLGLALVRALVQLHGGSVAAFSDGADTGSEFVVRLPLTVQAEPDPPEDRSPLPVTVEAARRIVRLMVVDDQVDGAQTLALLLRMMGHEVRVAHNGPEALEAAVAFRPEIVLLDIGLPGGMDGYEVARRLRAHPGLERTVLVALTGHGGAADRGRAREAGFSDYFVKPVDVEALGRFLDHQAGMDILGEGTAFAHPQERMVQTSAAESQVVPRSSVRTRASHV